MVHGRLGPMYGFGGFRVEGLGFEVLALGFGVLGIGVWGLGFGVHGLGFGVQGFGTRSFCFCLLFFFVWGGGRGPWAFFGEGSEIYFLPRRRGGGWIGFRV